jgi:hypothetical protein
MIDFQHELCKKPKKLFRLDPFKLLLMSVFLSTFFVCELNAQEVQQDTEPPPLKVISKEEREKLFEVTKLKERTKLVLELMDVRLGNSEDLFAKKQFPEMFKELGRFHALVDNGLAFLRKNDDGKGKVLDGYKRFEIGLRAFLPRLEIIRRELPLNYEFYVRTLMKNVSDARKNAVDPQYSDTVVPRNQKPN